MKIFNPTFLTALLFIVSCGAELNAVKNQSGKQGLVEVSGAELPRTIILVTNETTNDTKAYELDDTLNFERMDDLSEAEKKSLTESLKGEQISTQASVSGFSINLEDFDLPKKNSISWYYGRYPGFYGYRYGYRFPYNYGYGYRYGGFRYAYYRPYFGYGYGYRYTRPYYW